MKRISIDNLQPEELQEYLNAIGFFRQVAMCSEKQLALLLEHSYLMELEAGEVLIEKGTVGESFYALLEGELAVFPDKRPGEAGISVLKPGQLLGVLSMINHEVRTATVACSCTDGAKVFVVDFGVFGELEDFSVISLETKLCLFREVVRETRATLDRYDLQLRQEQFTLELAMLDDGYGASGDLDELEFLAEQANGMVWMLDTWNQKVKPTVTLFDEDAITNRLSSLLGIQGAAAS